MRFRAPRGDEMNNNQSEFLKQYRAAVRVEAEYIFNALRDTASSDHFEPDLFIDDVLAEIHKLKRGEYDE